MEIIKIGNKNYYNCEKCKLYYNQKLEKISEVDVIKLKQEEQEKFPFNETESLKKFENTIYYFYDYYPTGKIRTPKQREFHEHILRIKEDNQYAYNFILPRLENTIKSNIELVICVIPSSQEGLLETPMRFLARELCKDNRIDGSSYLVRKYTIPKKHIDGERDIQTEIDSLYIDDTNIIENEIVVILDDLTTTGVSMKAAIHHIKKAKAKKVYGLAIAKTVWY